MTDAKEVIRDLVNAMEMQQGRENGSLHITQLTMRSIWDRALDDARLFMQRDKDRDIER